MSTAPRPSRRSSAGTASPARPRGGARAKAEPGTVSALDRGLALLRCFSAEQRTLGPTELARLTGIPRPSVTRLAATLVTHRLLQPEPGGERFQLGPGVVALAQVFLSGLDIRAAARGPMQALAERTSGSVYLAVRDGLEMVLIEACKARSTMLTARLDVGSRVPMPNSALGRAWLGSVDAATRDETLAALRQARGADWPALEASLNPALARHARSGIAVSAGEFHREINSVAMALVAPRGEVMVFNCGGPAYAFPEQRLRDEVAPALAEMVRTVAAAVGGRAVLPGPTLPPT